MVYNTGFTPANRCLPRQTHHLKKRNDFKKQKNEVHTHSLCFLHAIHLCFLHAKPSPLPHRSPEQNDFEEERVLAVPTGSSSGVVPSFACPNLHHTTHRVTPPHRSPELCVELVNIPELPRATIQRFVFHDFPFLPIWISNDFDGFF